jgi:ribosome-associated protein
VRQVVPALPDAVELARVAVAGADDKKATDVAVLDVADIMAVVDVFVLTSTRNERQLKAAAESIEERVRQQLERRPLRREGTPASGWFLLDYGDVVCHVFDEEQRAFYDLDRLWADVPRLDPRTGQATVAPASTGAPLGHGDGA